MQEYSLHGRKLSETFQRVLQITTGGTVLDGSGDTRSLYVNGNFSADTIFVGGDNLYNIFAPIGGSGSGATTFIQNGNNTYTGGTILRPTINITGGTFHSLNVTGTSTFNVFNATTISSGGTSLETIIQNLVNDGTLSLQQAVSLTSTQLATKANLSGASFTGVINSGGTNLDALFAHKSELEIANVLAALQSIQLSTKANLSGASFTGTIFSAGTDLGDIFSKINHTHAIADIDNLTNVLGTKANLSGATFTGPVVIPTGRSTGFSATTLSGGTIYSAGTDLSLIFATIGSGGATDLTPVYDRLNTKANLSGATFTGTIDAPLILSAGTDLYNIFAKIGSGGATDLTEIYARLGTKANLSGATFTGSVILTDARADSFSATTLSGGTVFSASTDISTLFAHKSELAITNALNTLQSAQLITKANLSGASFTGVINSGGTNLDALFAHKSELAITNALGTLQSAQLLTKANLSATTFTGTVNIPTIQSGGTNLDALFAHKSELTITNALNTLQSAQLVTKANLSGASFTGIINSGGTNLDALFAHKSELAITNALGTLQSAQLGTKANLSAATFTGTVNIPTIQSGGTNLDSLFAHKSELGLTNAAVTLHSAQLLTKADLSGSTFTGAVVMPTGRSTGFSATTLSGGTVFSASTDISTLFAHKSELAITNALGTLQSAQLLTKANLSAATFTGTVNIPTIQSGGTNLDLLFAHKSELGLTNAAVTLINSQLATKANLSGASFTGIINSGGTNLDALFAHKSELAITNALNTLQSAQLLTKADLSGATFTGAVVMPTGRATGFSATTLSGGTIFSASTDVSTLFAHKSELTITNAAVTLINAQLPTKANLSGASFTGVINSGGTNLDSLFAHKSELGLTNTAVTLINAQLPTKADLSGATFTGTVNISTIQSGGTNLDALFAHKSELAITNALGTLQSAQLLTKANLSGSTFTGPVVLTTGRATSFSATTLSGGTIYSAGTDLSLIFATIGSGTGTDYTPQLNTKANLSGASFTGVISSGGTDLSLIFATIGSGVGIDYSPQLNTKANLSGATFTGEVILTTGRATGFSATTLSGGTIFSASTDISTLFAHKSELAITNALGTLHTAQFLTKANLSGASFTGIINSGGTNLDALFAHKSELAITNAAVTLQASQLLTKANLSGASFTGIINSGGTNLDALFAHKSELAITNALNTLQSSQLLTKADLSGSTFTGTVNIPTIQSGGTNLDALFAHKSELGLTNALNTLQSAQLLAKADLSGSTFTGAVVMPTGRATGFSATTLSGGTVFSANTDISTLFAHKSELAITNALGTLQSAQLLTKANLSGASFTGIINSGGTNLDALFAHKSELLLTNAAVTLVQSQLPTKANLSGASFTGVINSGGTNLDALFAHKSELAITNALGTLQSAQLLTKANLSAATFTGTVNIPTIQSGGTNLDALFAHKSELGLTNAAVTLHSAQLLTKADLSGATFTGAVVMPTGRATGFSATTLSGGTVFSASTDISTLFAHKSELAITNALGTLQSAQLATKANLSGASFTGIINSGGTNLDALFAHKSELGLTNAAVTLINSQLPTKANLSGASFTGVINSGGTNLDALFAHKSELAITNALNTLQSSQLLTKANLSGASFTGVISSGGTDLSLIFATIGSGVGIDYSPQLNTKANLSGATFTGEVILTTGRATGFSATTLSGGTIFSASTDISTLFAHKSELAITNALGTLHTAQFLTKANLSGATFTGTVNIPTIQSGGTNLDALFAHKSELGLTNAAVTLINAQLPTKANLSGASFTGIINSGGTNLDALFTHKSELAITNALNTLQSSQLLTKANLSGASFTGVISSGGTDLSLIFATIGSGVGTDYSPQLNTKANLSGATFTGEVIMSTGRATGFSATTLSGGTVFSASTDISTLFAHKSELAITNALGALHSAQFLTKANLSGASFTGIINSGGTNLDALFAHKSELAITNALGTLQSAQLLTKANLSAATFTGTVNIPTIQSGGTNLDSLFAHKSELAITNALDTLQTAQLATKANLSGGTFTGPITSGGTDLSNLFARLGGGAGEANTASNVGSGAGVFKTKSGVDLQFKTLSAGTNITINTADTNTILISAAAGSVVISQATINFGPITQRQFSTATTIADVNITATSKILMTLSAEATAEHSSEEILFEDVRVAPANLVAGVSFDILAYCPKGTYGSFKVNYTISY